MLVISLAHKTGRAGERIDAMSWYEAACELEKYLPWNVQITPGTGGNRNYCEPPLPLHRLEKGVPLYDVTTVTIP
jgi:hypothetical protein